MRFTINNLVKSYGSKEVLKGLKSSGGYLRRILGQNLQLRYTPELVWEEDTSITHGARIFDILATLDIPEDAPEETEHDE